MDIDVHKIMNREIDFQLSSEVIKMHKERVILITGAAGFIGSEISTYIAEYCESKVILLDQSETGLYHLQQKFRRKRILKDCIFIVGNICDKRRINKLFNEHNIDIVYHIAAYKHVPLMEENIYEAIKVNVKGTTIIADAALNKKCEKFVLISTDKAVKPISIMGASKRIAEMYVNSLNEKGKTKFLVTRFGNVMGSTGSVVPLFQQQLKHGEALTVTHKNMTRYFMSIQEACQLVLEAGTMGKGGEIFVFEMGEPMKIYDLALKMIQLSGFKFPSEIDIKITGVRPGEKIEEELLTDSENLQTTYHPKIKIAKLQRLDAPSVSKNVKELLKVNKKLDAKLTVSLMKEMIAEFVLTSVK